MNDSGSCLRCWRLMRGLTQRELSEISSVNLRLIQQYEQGSRDFAKAQLRTVFLLADSLGVTIEELLFR